MIQTIPLIVASNGTIRVLGFERKQHDSLTAAAIK
jgi:hypothetical protein